MSFFIARGVWCSSQPDDLVSAFGGALVFRDCMIVALKMAVYVDAPYVVCRGDAV